MEIIYSSIIKTADSLSSDSFLNLLYSTTENSADSWFTFSNFITLAFYVIIINLLVKWLFKGRPPKDPKLYREYRIKELINKLNSVWTTEDAAKKVLQEELNLLRKEREKENRDILNSANQNEKLVFELKKEIENLKNELGTLKSEKGENEKSENEKLLEIISKQKSVISDLEMELKIKKSENEKLIY
ncbi:MAG: hypothetical protein FWF51_03035 [Chitinivibrionia bacterium]|nr:hypothetical protein [Chitinivibrionia bacterium]